MRALTSILLLLIISTPAGSGILNPFTAKIFSEKPDCFSQVISHIAGQKVNPTVRLQLLNSAQYNELISKKLKDFAQHEWEPQLEKVIDHFAVYDKNFKGPEFKSWLKENPDELLSTKRRLFGIRRSTLEARENTTFGDYINQKYKKFKKTNPEKGLADLKAAEKELPDALKKIVSECNQNAVCEKSALGKWLDQKLNWSCIWKNKSAMTAMKNALIVSNVGYGIKYATNPDDGLPYELMATDLFWTPFFTEVGCRNTLASQQIGKKIDFGQPLKRIEKFKRGVNNYYRYMLLSPVVNGSIVGAHTVIQVSSGDKKWEDIQAKDIVKQIGSLTLWDAMYVVPRHVLFQDKFYMKTVPKLSSQFIARFSPANAPIAKGATNIMDYASRAGIVWWGTDWYEKWEDYSDEHLGTKFHRKKAATEPNP